MPGSSEFCDDVSAGSSNALRRMPGVPPALRTQPIQEGGSTVDDAASTAEQYGADVVLPRSASLQLHNWPASYFIL